MREDIDFSESLYCAVGKSKICDGQGLFALKRFVPGEIVVDYHSNFLNWKRELFTNIPEPYAALSWWVGEEDKTHCRLANKESLFMRANHSFSPNTTWFPNSCMLIANHTIYPGEEITFNYTLEIAPEFIKQQPPNWLLL